MANRYWVGGTGTWDSSSTTNWSASSGGAGGASVPGNADSVFFDGNSGTGNCTHLNYSGNSIGPLNFTGYTGTFTNSASLRVDGSLTFSSTMTLGGSSDIYVWPGNLGVSKTANYTSNGKSPYVLEFIAQAGSTVNIQDNINADSIYFSLRNGTINVLSKTVTASNRVSLASIYDFGSGGPNTLYLTGSTFNCPKFGMNGGGTATLTISASSTTVNISGSDPSIDLGGPNVSAFTMSTVNVTATTNVAYSQYNTALHRVGTLNITSPTTTHNFNTNFYTNTLNVTGSAKTLQSNSSGTARTLTAASSYSLANVSFKDITAAGNIPFSGTGLVDLGGNTNITFLIPGSSLFFGSNF